MDTQQIKVWDRLVRLLHWSLVVLFVTAYLSGESETPAHVYAGYGIAVVLVVRILWGLFGSRHARFASFLRSPRAAVDYLIGLARGDAPRYLGHNPAGGWMAVLLMLSLAATGVTGLLTYGAEGHGPLAGMAGTTSVLPGAHADDDEDEDAEHLAGAWAEAEHEDEASEVFEEWHEFFANFSVFLVVLHLAGVAASSLVHRENLVRSMLTGFKRAADAPPRNANAAGPRPAARP